MTVAFLFPGQGSQTPDMREHVARWCRDLAELAVEAVGEDPFARLDDGTRFLQPALLCASLAGGTRLVTLGVTDVDGVAGHSLGEIAALVAAGSICPEHGIEPQRPHGRGSDRPSCEARDVVSRRVVVTGVGAVSPLGTDAVTLIDRWIAGECGLADGRGLCSEFDPLVHLSRKEVRRTDRFAQLAVAAAKEAMTMAGWGNGIPYVSERIGSVVGTGIGGLATISTEHASLQKRGPAAVLALLVPLMMTNATSAAIAMRRGFFGPNFSVRSACAASAHAIGTAFKLIQSGKADAMITGGAESAINEFAAAGFAATGATSRTGISRPFDARRDGFVLGEGAGILVLESAESAHARNASVVGEILGYGASSDAFHSTAPEPDGAGVAHAISFALDDAGIEPSDLDYVNAHGTSTPLNDRSETEALKRALGAEAERLPVSSTKSAIGHLLGAGGAVELVSTLLALARRVMPPTLGYEEPDAGLDLDYVPGEARALQARANGTGSGRALAISNSFGFGGHNAVLCVAA